MPSASSSSAAAGGTTGGGGQGATGTNQLARALETRDDEVASASLLVQAMWKADGWQEGTLISTLTQVFQSAQNKASRSHQGYALSHVLALVPSDTLVERCCAHICSVSQPGGGQGRHRRKSQQKRGRGSLVLEFSHAAAHPTHALTGGKHEREVITDVNSRG